MPKWHSKHQSFPTFHPLCVLHRVYFKQVVCKIYHEALLSLNMSFVDIPVGSEAYELAHLVLICLLHPFVLPISAMFVTSSSFPSSP